MSRDDVVLLVLWCVGFVFVSRTFEFGTSTMVIGLLAGGIVFAIRLWLARRSFRR